MKAVNLLPHDQRGVAKATAAPAAGRSGGTAAYAVLGALAVGVVSVAGYVLTGNDVKDRQVQLAGATAQELVLQAELGNLKPYADFAQLASARVATVKDLAGRRFDWENALRDLSRAIPANVTVASLTGTVTSETGSGGSSLRSAIPAPAIAVTGCTDSQAAVATLMARLRTVDGVTRVSLAKSAKNDAPGAAAVPTTPSGPAVSVSAEAACGTGRRSGLRHRLGPALRDGHVLRERRAGERRPDGAGRRRRHDHPGVGAGDRHRRRPGEPREPGGLGRAGRERDARHDLHQDRSFRRLT
jgi:Tfp pilus assembly protein PilN